MFRHMDAGLSGEGQGQNFACRNVPRVVRLGKLRDGELVVGKANSGLGPGPAKWRTSAKKKT